MVESSSSVPTRCSKRVEQIPYSETTRFHPCSGDQQGRHHRSHSYRSIRESCFQRHFVQSLVASLQIRALDPKKSLPGSTVRWRDNRKNCDQGTWMPNVIGATCNYVEAIWSVLQQRQPVN